MDVVEFKAAPMSKAGVQYAPSAIHHLSRYDLLILVRNEEAASTAEHSLTKFSRFHHVWHSGKAHSNQGAEFGKKLVYALPEDLGFNETRATSLRAQGDSVSEEVHSTIHAMLVMHMSVGNKNWASLLPSVQMTFNTSYPDTVHETPSFPTFGR